MSDFQKASTVDSAFGAIGEALTYFGMTNPADVVEAISAKLTALAERDKAPGFAVDKAIGRDQALMLAGVAHALALAMVPDQAPEAPAPKAPETPAPEHQG